MTEASGETLRTAQVNGIYQALGRFITEFSRMVSAMETSLCFCVGGNQQLFLAVTAELTADPLARAWRSIMSQTTDLTDTDQTILSSIHGEVVHLIQVRNNWSHGTWFVGYGNDLTTDWSQAWLHRHKNSSKGLVVPSDLETLPTADYIEQVASHTEFMTQVVLDFGINVQLLRNGTTTTRPSDRIRVIKVDDRRQFQMSSNGITWKSSSIPVRAGRPSVDGSLGLRPGPHVQCHRPGCITLGSLSDLQTFVWWRPGFIGTRELRDTDARIVSCPMEVMFDQR